VHALHCNSDFVKHLTHTCVRQRTSTMFWSPLLSYDMSVNACSTDETCNKQRTRKELRKQRDMHQARVQQHEVELGAQHPATGRECMHLARVCLQLSETEDAKRLLVQAQRICKLWQGYFSRSQAATTASYERILNTVEHRATAMKQAA
jgi:hypothetical protein